jgi:hypothetical protein
MVIVWRNDCVEVKSRFQGSYMFWFYSDMFTHFHIKIRGIIWQHTLVVSRGQEYYAKPPS